jgi:uncharacterized protein
MTTPYITTLTAGIIIILQILLAFRVSGFRGKKNLALGDGDDADTLRVVRRHGNLAENAGVFIAGFTLLEISKFAPMLLLVLCVLFVIVRVSHAVGMSRTNTMNGFRMIGGIGTYGVGLVLGGALVWLGIVAALAAHQM